MAHKAVVIAIVNQKGGVAKTTTSISLGHGLALEGKRTLLIDFDPQGNLTVYLGLRQEPCIYDWLTYRLTPAGAEKNMTVDHMRQWIRISNRDNLFVFPGDKWTKDAEDNMKIKGMVPASYVRECLSPLVNSGLDYIVFDTAPSVTDMQSAAVWASDLVLIPTMLDFGSLFGVKTLTEDLRKLTGVGWKGKVAGILPTYFKGKMESEGGEQIMTGGTTVTRQQYDSLMNYFGQDMIWEPIHDANVFREASSANCTIFEMPGTDRITQRAQEEYQKVVQRILRLR
jgi:cellulose biosynthesis protein BcsQ